MRHVMKRIAMLMVVVCIVSASAMAEWVSPTRNPDALEYDKENPQSLTEAQIVADGFVLMDMDSGEALMARNADQAYHPASLVQLALALVLAQAGQADDVLTVPEDITALPEVLSVVGLVPGEEITLQDALYALLMDSAADAGFTAAWHYSGEAGTLDSMNGMANALGCQNTSFTDLVGFDPGNHSTPMDMARLFAAAMEQPLLRDALCAKQYTIKATNMSAPRTLNSNIQLMVPVFADADHYHYDNALGGKIGFMEADGYCLAAAAKNEDRTLVCVQMHTGKYSCWVDASRLFEYGFAQPVDVSPSFDIAEYYLPGYTYGSLLNMYALGEEGMLCHLSADGNGKDVPSGELLVRYDGEGNLLWHHAFEQYVETEQGGSDIMLLSDGRFARMVYRSNRSAYVQYFDKDTGYTGQTPVFETDILIQAENDFIVPAKPVAGKQNIQRIDWEGNMTKTWTYAHDGDVFSGARAAVDVQGGMLLLDNDHSKDDHMAVYKFDEEGKMIWECRLPGDDGYASMMLSDGEGGALVYGYGMVDNLQHDTIFRVDSEGELIWSTELTPLEFYLSKIIPTDGGWYLLGPMDNGYVRYLLTPDGEVTGKDARRTLFTEDGARLQFGPNDVSLAPDGTLLLGGPTWLEGDDIWQYWPTVVPFDALPKL